MCQRGELVPVSRSAWRAMMACPLVPWKANALVDAIAEMHSALQTLMLDHGFTTQADCLKDPIESDIIVLPRKVFIVRRCKLGIPESVHSKLSAKATPSAPDAGSVCPTQDFGVDAIIGIDRHAVAWYTAMTALSSIGSPSEVPVPWSLTTFISFPLMFAMQIAFFKSICCAWPLGAANVAERPSWLIAVPTINGEVDLSFRSFRWTNDAKHASDRTYPSAATSSALQRPSRASMPAAEKRSVVLVCKVTFDPATIACECKMEVTVLPLSFALSMTIRCSATIADEHAVSTQKLGPVNPNE